jgi:adenylate kinase family enzyme
MRILVLGIPFAGKTYMSGYMKEHGYNAIDGDYIEGLSTFITSNGTDVTSAVQSGTYKGRRVANRIWQLDFLEQYLNNQPGPIIIFGWSANITDALSLFDTVFYLGLTQNELAYRFDHNEREHDYGKTLDQQLRIKAAHKKWLRTARHKKIPILRATSSPASIEKSLKDALQS